MKRFIAIMDTKESDINWIPRVGATFLAFGNGKNTANITFLTPNNDWFGKLKAINRTVHSKQMLSNGSFDYFIVIPSKNELRWAMSVNPAPMKEVTFLPNKSVEEFSICFAGLPAFLAFLKFGYFAETVIQSAGILPEESAYPALFETFIAFCNMRWDKC